MADDAASSVDQPLPSLCSSSSPFSASRQELIGSVSNVDLTERARAAVYSGPPRRTIGNDDTIFDHGDAKIKEDVVRLIIQYLEDEGYAASIMTIQDEASVRFAENLRNRSHFKRIKAAILDGEWLEMEKLVQKTPLKDHKHFLYTVYKQQYLELIEQLEYQKAFALLTRRLKPLEQMGSLHNEFKDLCYLLTCKSIQDAPFFRSWEGVASSREKLVDQFSSMLEIENNDIAGVVLNAPFIVSLVNVM